MNPREYRRRAHAAVGVIGALGLAYLAQTFFLRRADLRAGLILVAVASVLMLRSVGGAEKLPEPLLGRGQFLTLMTAILFVAAATRFWDLAAIPQGVWFDEAENGLVATRILRDPAFHPIFIGDLTQLPSLFFYYLAGWIALLGSNILAVRLASASLGLLTVPLLYQLGRELFGQRVGLIAAFFLAVSRWDVNFSRFGMNGIAAPFFLVGALYFLARGLRTMRYRDFAIAGVAIGLGLNTYLAFNVAPILIGLWLLHQVVRSRFALLQGEPLRRIAVTVVAALLIFAPLGVFAVQHQAEFVERTKTASLFTGKTPEQARVALVSNVVQHAEMFNVRGDRNGRHNLAGVPELDDLTAALFLLGIVLAASRVREARYLLLLLWLGLLLLPGILSLDFEAPQSYRSIGVIPVTALLAALPIAAALRLASGWLGKVSLRPLSIVAALALVSAGYSNLHTYWFVQIWDNSSWAEFSTQATLIAREVNRLGPGYRVYMDPIFVDTPTIRFLAPQLKSADQHVFDPAKDLPFRQRLGSAVFVSDLNLSWIDALHRDYPSAALRQYRVTPNAPSILYSALVSPAEVDAPRGLVGQYASGSGADARPVFTRQDKTLDFDWRQAAPLPFPFQVDWKGTLAAPSDGTYVFRLDGPPGASLKIDEAVLIHAGERKSIHLALGTHRVEVAGPFDRPASLRLLWQPPAGLMQVVPAKALYSPPVRDRGLQASYYPNATWSGPPRLQEIDPDVSKHFHLLPLPQPFSVEWVGKIDCPVPGTYRFGTQSIDHSWLWIDGKLVVDNSREVNQYTEGLINLNAGLHDIRIRFQDETGHNFISVFWTPPGPTGRVLLPADRLFPPAAAYPERAGPLQSSAPAFSSGPLPPAVGATAPGALPSVVGVNATLPLPVTSFRVLREIGGPGDGPGQLKDPRGVAVDAAGNTYVVDTGHRVVKKYDPKGTYLATIGNPGQGDPNALPSGHFLEPVAVAIEPSGNVLILDSESAWIERFRPDGTFVARFAGPRAGFYHPRDLKVDLAGNIYVADTGTSHIAVFNPEGQLVTREGQHGKDVGQLGEPVSVAVDSRGGLLVSDTANDRLTRFEPPFQATQVWTVPRAPSVVGPHLALAPDGSFYLSDPPGHRVIHFDPTGRPVDQLGTGSQLTTPIGVFVDPRGDVYVADSGAGKVVVFGP